MQSKWSSRFVREYHVLQSMLRNLMSLSLHNHIKFLAILYPKSLANLVVDVGTMHSDHTLFPCMKNRWSGTVLRGRLFALTHFWLQGVDKKSIYFRKGGCRAFGSWGNFGDLYFSYQFISVLNCILSNPNSLQQNQDWPIGPWEIWIKL